MASGNALSRVVQIIITGNTDQAVHEIEKLVGTTEVAAKKSGTAFASMGKYVAVGIAAAAVATAVYGAEEYQKLEVAEARLRNAIKNTGGEYEHYAGRIEKATHAAINLGFEGADLVSSLGRLTAITKDADKALSDMSLAEDISRARKIDLQAATDILAKVEAGRVGLLGRLGINVKDATGATISQEEALRKLADMYGGSASAYAETFTGKIAILKAQMIELSEHIGAEVIPIVAALGGAVADSIGWFEEHTDVAKALAAVIGGVLVASMVAWIKTWEFTRTLATFEVIKGAVVGLVSAMRAATAATIGYFTAQTGAQVAATSANAAYMATVATLEAEVITLAAAEQALTLAEYEVATGALAEAEGLALVAGAELAVTEASIGVVAAQDAVALSAVELAAAETAAATSMSLLALTAGTLGVAAIAVGIGLLVNEVFGLDSGLDDFANHLERGEKAGEKFARVAIAQATALHDEADAHNLLKLRLRDTNAQLDESVRLYDKGKLSVGEAAEAYKKHEAAAKGLKGELKKLNEEHEVSTGVLKAVTIAYGITLPDGIKRSTKETKELTQGIADSIEVFGAARVQNLVNMGATGDALKNLAKDTKSFQDAVVNAMEGSTNAFAKFGAKGAESQDEFNKFFTGSIEQSERWVAKVQELIARGVDQGIIGQIARAGPESEPALDQFIAMTNKFGVQWVNDWAARGNAAKDAMVNSIADMQFAIEQRLEYLRYWAATHPVNVYFNLVAPVVSQQLAPFINGTANLPVPFGAEGAIVSRPTLALIGEAGPEVLTPLHQMPGASPLSAFNTNTTSGTPVQVYIGSDELTRAVVDGINRASRGGPVLLSAAVRGN